jgi:hypothetical protein
MNVVKIDNGVVTQLWRNTTKAAVAKALSADDAATLREVGEGVAPGMVMTDGGYAVPPPSLADLLAYASAARDRKVFGGITIGVKSWPTDQRTLDVIQSAYQMALANSEYAIPDFKVGADYLSLSNADIRAAGEAMVAHVQACFTRNKTVDAAIRAGSMTSRAAIDGAFAELPTAY